MIEHIRKIEIGNKKLAKIKFLIFAVYAKPFILKYESGNLTVDNSLHPTFLLYDRSMPPFIKKIDNELYLFHRETKTIYKWDDAQSKFVDAGFPFYGEIFKLGEE